MPYHVGAKGSYGCSGFPALKDGTNEVMGCHSTKAAAAAQIYAINRSEGNIGKAATNLVEGDFAMTEHGGKGDFHIGQVVHVMYEGMLGNTGTDYALQATPENPVVLIQLFEQEEDGTWEATRLYSACSMGLMVKIPSLKTEESEEMGSETMMAMYDSSIDKREMANVPYEDADSKSYYSDDEEMDKWDNIAKACWVGYEQQGMKEKDGRMVPNCVPVSKSEQVEKAKSVSVGDHVTFAVPKPPDKTESAHGVVERVERSGTVKLPGTNESVEASSNNPVAVIRVYAMDENGKMTRTDRRVVKPFSSLRVSSEPINAKMYDEDMEKASAKVESRLRELAEDYNKGKEGNKKITVGTLRQVYNRGIGAYRTNPSSVRGSVSSAEQWAMGRVNAFMAGLKGRFPRKPFDLDLFPSGHPRSTKKSIFTDFGQEVSGSVQLREVFMNTEKREFSGAARERMSESGAAMPDGSFPIANASDLRNAIQSVGRAKNYQAAKEHIISRARALGMVDMLPEDWKPGVRKTMWGGSIFDLNPFTK